MFIFERALAIRAKVSTDTTTTDVVLNKVKLNTKNKKEERKSKVYLIPQVGV